MKTKTNIFIFKILPLFRIFLYIALYLSFALIPVEAIEKESLCATYNDLNIICISCGTTRAFSNIMHLNFLRAFSYNQFFVLAIFPICTLLFLQDIIVFLSRLILKRDIYSVIEYPLRKIYE